jgi:hypothetical protein
VGTQRLDLGNRWRSLRVIALVLSPFAVICGLVYLTLIAIPRAVDEVALRRLANRLGTEPSKLAIVSNVTSAVESRKGSTRAEIHALLASVGEFEYAYGHTDRDGQSMENANWTLAKVPLGKIWAVWILRYDASDRLTKVEIGESWP